MASNPLGSSDKSNLPRPPHNKHHPGSAPPPVVHAPAPHYGQSQYTSPYPPPNSGAWTTGLCGCFEDWPSCCVGLWCPCVLVGKSVEALDQGTSSCPLGCSVFLLLHALLGCGCLYTFIYRTRLRQKYGLPETPCPDFCVDFWCLECSICQVYRELENRNAILPDPDFGISHPPTASAAPDVQYMKK